MSRIDDLIQELCPSGVEYKQLGDVGRVVRGKRFVKDDMIDAGVPCVHYGEIYTQVRHFCGSEHLLRIARTCTHTSLRAAGRRNHGISWRDDRRHWKVCRMAGE